MANEYFCIRSMLYYVALDVLLIEQSANGGRESWLHYFHCVAVVGVMSRCRAFVCSQGYIHIIIIVT